MSFCSLFASISALQSVNTAWSLISQSSIALAISIINLPLVTSAKSRLALSITPTPLKPFLDIKLGMMPALMSDDLPVPLGPRIKQKARPNSICFVMRFNKVLTCSLRPKNTLESLVSNARKPGNGEVPCHCWVVTLA